MKDGDREGAYYSGGRIFFRVGLKLSSQAKIDGAHGVESWKDLSHGEDVFLNASFLDGLVVGCKEACADVVSEYL